MMRRPQLRSTFARAVVPVLGGIGFFAVLGLALWGVAAIIAGNRDDTTDNLAPSVQEMGSTSFVAAVIDDDGPIILHDLLGDDRNVVVDHTGADVDFGWAIYLAQPADRDAGCGIELIKETRTFTDCEGRTLQISDLAAPPPGVGPVISADGDLSLDLTAD
jgi:threonine dehydrogenase-like Zn-dependent dehydrogenase